LDEDLVSLRRLSAPLGVSASSDKGVLLLDLRSIGSVICNFFEQDVSVPFIVDLCEHVLCNCIRSE
jgi:hypothetical protein